MHKEEAYSGFTIMFLQYFYSFENKLLTIRFNPFVSSVYIPMDPFSGIKCYEDGTLKQ